MYWFKYKTKYGFIKVEYSGKDLLRIDLNPKAQKRDKDYKVYKDLKDDLFGYFNGNKMDFTKYNIIYDKLTAFEKKVLKKVKLIPYGKRKSYSQISKDIGNAKACRAVGNALNKNPLPIIIPCHRVIQSNGKLGGFSADPKWKKILLHLENHKILKNNIL